MHGDKKKRMKVLLNSFRLNETMCDWQVKNYTWTDVGQSDDFYANYITRDGVDMLANLTNLAIFVQIIRQHPWPNFSQNATFAKFANFFGAPLVH